MGEVDAVVEYCRFAEDEILGTDAIGLLGVFATIKPREVGDGGAIRKMGHDTLLARSHGEGLEAEDMTNDLHIRHIAREFVDGVDLRAVDIFVRIVFEQVTIGLNAELVAQHLLAVRPYARQVFDILV